MTKETAMKILKELHDKSLFAERTALETIIPELTDSNDEKIRKALIRFHKSTIDVDGIKGDDILAWLEKQGEQKPILDFKASNCYVSKVDGKIHDMTYNPTDKVELKFKVGDWIVGVLEGFYKVIFYKVIAIDREYDTGKYGYILLEPSGNEIAYSKEFIDENFHLWTIADAKKGDVLCWDKSKCIALFKNIYDKESFNSYGFVGHCTGKFESRLSYHSIEGAHPATKEQRDLLFAKMKEASYEWNDSTKELKKIEDEIEIPFGAKDSELQEATYYIPKGFHAEIDDDKVVIKKGEKSAAWSEEDENYLQSAENACEYQYGKNTSTILWLKSLKDRIGG